MRAMFHTRFVDEDYADAYDYADEFDDDDQPTEDFSDGYYDDGSAEQEPQAWPSADGAPAGVPLADETPTITEPTARSHHPKRALRNANSPMSAKTTSATKAAGIGPACHVSASTTPLSI